MNIKKQNQSNERKISFVGTEGRMTSVEIAEITGKTHAYVLKAIRKMEPAWEKVNEVKFALVEYTDSKGEKRPMYALSKTECLYIATKFNDEARAKLVLRWAELEKANYTSLLAKSRESREDGVYDADYPTLEDYFRKYVPVEYFVNMLFSIMKEYSSMAEILPEEADNAYHKVSVLLTFTNTLAANHRRGAFA